jgi:hypothetical protein
LFLVEIAVARSSSHPSLGNPGRRAERTVSFGLWVQPPLIVGNIHAHWFLSNLGGATRELEYSRQLRDAPVGIGSIPVNLAK